MSSVPAKKADKVLEKKVEKRVESMLGMTDANDMAYAFDASFDYFESVLLPEEDTDTDTDTNSSGDGVVVVVVGDGNGDEGRRGRGRRRREWTPRLEDIQAPLVAINSADDQVNPPELGILEREVKKVKNGRAVILPITKESRGHGSHTWAKLWKDELVVLLEESEAAHNKQLQQHEHQHELQHQQLYQQKANL